jgi:hypothetical protein
MNICSCGLVDESFEVAGVPARALPAVLEGGGGLGLAQQNQGHVLEVAGAESGSTEPYLSVKHYYFRFAVSFLCSGCQSATADKNGHIDACKPLHAYTKTSVCETLRL